MSQKHQHRTTGTNSQNTQVEAGMDMAQVALFDAVPAQFSTDHSSSPPPQSGGRHRSLSAPVNVGDLGIDPIFGGSLVDHSHIARFRPENLMSGLELGGEIMFPPSKPSTNHNNNNNNSNTNSSLHNNTANNNNNNNNNNAPNLMSSSESMAHLTKPMSYGRMSPPFSMSAEPASGIIGSRPRASSVALHRPTARDGHGIDLDDEDLNDTLNNVSDTAKLPHLARLSLQVVDSPSPTIRARAHSSPQSPAFFMPALLPSSSTFLRLSSSFAPNNMNNNNNNNNSSSRLAPPSRPVRPGSPGSNVSNANPNNAVNNVNINNNINPNAMGSGGVNANSLLSSSSSSPNGGMNSMNSSVSANASQNSALHSHNVMSGSVTSPLLLSPSSRAWSPSPPYSMQHDLNELQDMNDEIPNDAPPAQECCNLFVNYLPQSVDDNMLHQLFKPFGDIESCKVMLDLNTHRSRCFGFVKYKSLENAKLAMQEMNGKRLEHKSLIVKYANTSDTTSVGTPSTNVYIKGLPPQYNNHDLRALFERYGVIEDCRVLVDVTSGVSRGIAFARFANIQDADIAISALNNSYVDGGTKPILVKFADTEDERTQRKLRQARRRKLQQMYMQHQMPASNTIPSNSLPNWDDQSAPYSHQQVSPPSPYPRMVMQKQLPPMGLGMAYPYAYAMHPRDNNDAVAVLGGMDGMSMGMGMGMGMAPDMGMGMGMMMQMPPQMSSSQEHVMHNPYMSAMPEYSQSRYDVPSTTELCVTNLPDTSESTLRTMFSAFGPVVSVKVTEPGKMRGTAFVQMRNFSDAVNAVAGLNRVVVSGNVLGVSFKKGM